MPKEKHWNGCFNSKESKHVPKHTKTRCRFCGEYGYVVCPECVKEINASIGNSKEVAV